MKNHATSQDLSLSNAEMAYDYHVVVSTSSLPSLDKLVVGTSADSRVPSDSVSAKMDERQGKRASHGNSPPKMGVSIFLQRAPCHVVRGLLFSLLEK